MKTLIFRGSSDDTFGEHAVTGDDYDNCASGEPIRWKVEADGLGVIVTGQYSPNGSGCWMIGVEAIDEDRIPSWKMRFELLRPTVPPFRNLSYRNHFEIDLPDSFSLTCMEREDSQ